MATGELLNFLAQYGRQTTDGPEILPAFNNYYQDISGGQSTLGNLTLLNEERMYPPGQPEPDYPDFEFYWFIDEELISTEGNPTLEDLNPGYSGVMEIELIIHHRPTGVTYTRTEFAYLGYNGGLANPNVQNDWPSQFGVFYAFYPEGVDVYKEYATLYYDADGDGMVGSKDLLTFLATIEN